jgi:hypothetical protein
MAMVGGWSRKCNDDKEDYWMISLFFGFVCRDKRYFLVAPYQHSKFGRQRLPIIWKGRKGIELELGVHFELFFDIYVCEKVLNV